MKIVINQNGSHVLFPWEYIGKGMEAKVYRKGNTAYKYYHLFPRCRRLNLEETQFLENITTNRILLPKTILFTPLGNFKGYTTTYVEDLGLFHFMKLPTCFILNDFKLLREDCLTLANQHIFVSDFLPKDDRIHNYSFHYGLYFVDPGRYFRDVDCPVEKVFENNIGLVDNFLFFRVLNSYANQLFGRDGYNFSRLYQPMKNTQISLMDYIANDIQEDTLGDYVKKKVL